MQDGTQEGNEAYVISHRGARSRGYKRRESEGEIERERVPTCVRLCLSRLPASHYVNVSVCVHVCPPERVLT
jgi:hypothetical protein